MIEALALYKEFQTGETWVPALRAVSFKVGAGETLALIGPSGAGKSTALRCLNLLERPESGAVKIAGRNILHLRGDDLRRTRQKIGMIFQHFNLLTNRTVAGNVAFALEVAGWPKAEIAPRVAEVLRLVQLEDKAQAYPARLSGGQKQRAAIARAIANRPDILLADEPTSALDPLTKLEVVRCLEHLRDQLGLTIVIATHEMGVVKRLCHRALLFKDHEIHEELLIEGQKILPTTQFGQAFMEVAT